MNLKNKKITLLAAEDYYFGIPTISRICLNHEENIKSIIIVQNFFSLKRMFYIFFMFNPIFIIKKILNSYHYKNTLNTISAQKKIKVFYTSNVNSKKTIRFLQMQKTQTLLILSCPQILKKEILKIKKTNLNFHCSNLPKNRGLFPLFYTYIDHNGKKLFLNLHAVNEKIDDGEILIYKKINTKKMRLEDMYTLAFIKFEKIIEDFIKNKYSKRNNIQKYKTYNSYPRFKDFIKYYKIVFFSK